MQNQLGNPSSSRMNVEQYIFRNEQRRRFTTVDNAIFDTTKLSATAIGVACLILSKPNDWQISIDQMARETREGKKALRSALKELATAGYVMRVRKHHADGTLSTVTLIADYPKFARIGTPEERIHGYALTPAAAMSPMSDMTDMTDMGLTDLASTDLPPTATSAETEVSDAHHPDPTDLPVGDTSVKEGAVTDLPPTDMSENRQVGDGQVILNTVVLKTDPLPDPGKRSSSSRRPNAEEDEEDALPAAVRAMWNQTYPDTPLPEKLWPKLAALVAECGAEAVAHGIDMSQYADSRSWRYIATCARNYVPAGPGNTRPARNPYQVALEPRPADEISRRPREHSCPPISSARGDAVDPTPLPPAPAAADAGQPDPLAAAWQEVRTELGLGAAAAWLEGSWLEDTGTEQGGKHLFRLRVADARHVAWLANRAGKQMSRILSSLLGQPAAIEIAGPAA